MLALGHWYQKETEIVLQIMWWKLFETTFNIIIKNGLICIQSLNVII